MRSSRSARRRGRAAESRGAPLPHLRPRAGGRGGRGRAGQAPRRPRHRLAGRVPRRPLRRGPARRTRLPAGGRRPGGRRARRRPPPVPARRGLLGRADDAAHRAAPPAGGARPVARRARGLPQPGHHRRAATSAACASPAPAGCGTRGSATTRSTPRASCSGACASSRAASGSSSTTRGVHTVTRPRATRRHGGVPPRRPRRARPGRHAGAVPRRRTARAPTKLRDLLSEVARRCTVVGAEVTSIAPAHATLARQVLDPLLDAS